MKSFAFVLAFAALALGMAHAVTTNNCPDGTKYFECSKINPGYLCTGSGPSLSIYNPNGKQCPCEAVAGWEQQGTGVDAVCVQKKCADGTLNGQCSAVTKPNVCVGSSTYADNATKCGCPAGKRVAAGGIFCEFVPCTDGGSNVSQGTCSANKPKQCVNGQLVNNATFCGCPNGQIQQGEACGIVCLDGTKDGACSATLPKQCVNGYLLDNATMCGCPEGLTAVGKQCTNSILGGASGADLLGGVSGNETGAAGSSNALTCCCLPTALIGIIGGFAFFRKN
ncbi:MAG: hypothetical protein NTX79_04670 [Candidatus Micrarchaeota archaeon]|nr:hypothetical protein [Candidatus Micrarchaeota archaeon]